jgi:hypothetical protein
MLANIVLFIRFMDRFCIFNVIFIFLLPNIFLMKKSIFFINAAIILCMLSACRAKPDMSAGFFGEKITPKNTISVQTVLTQLQNADKIENIQVTGKVSSVCQVKGCWMTLVSPQSEQPPLFVKFKAYGFFVPKDLSGSEVTMQGDAFKEITPINELKHYAEDEGKTKAEIDVIIAPKTEYKFLAKGVVIVRK